MMRSFLEVLAALAVFFAVVLIGALALTMLGFKPNGFSAFALLGVAAGCQILFCQWLWK